ncbi:hypothetical protein J3E68DRAFT_412443 [Trichoderma sp. SZMC 28012]
MDNNQKQSLRQKVAERFSGSTRCLPNIRFTTPKDREPVEIALTPLSFQRSRGSHGFIPRQTMFSRFLQLPPELQFKILGYLDFGEIQQLRQTCRLFRNSINREVTRYLFPRLNEWKLRTCYICLKYREENEIVMGSALHMEYPFTSKCFDCIARRSYFMVGKSYTLANSEAIYVCRWCGIPVTVETGWNQPEYHVPCYEKFKRVIVLHYTIGMAQGMVVLAGSALCWHYFKHQLMVIIPVVFAFIMGFWATLLNSIRGHAMRTYHWSMLVELFILAVWIPPMYEVVNKAIVNRSTSDLHVSRSATYWTLVLIALNMMFRLLNAIGMLILFCEWKMWLRSRPGISWLRRMAGKVMMMLVICADPQSLQQEYPGRWWFKRRPHFMV